MRQVTDVAELEELLNRDWTWTGFAIGDLEPALLSHCEWWCQGDALVLLFDGLSPRLACHYGGGTGLADILAGVPDERVWVNVRPQFEAEFTRVYRPDKCVRMRRMYLQKRVTPEGVVDSLHENNRAEVEELLAHGEWVLFLPAMLKTGLFRGVRDGRRLVAVAGVHLASTRFNIAALGSVFVHPSYRQRGLARLCSGHVIASLQEQGIDRIVLNVEDTNDRAKRVYERLGFESALVYLDGECVRVK
jgi:ribosomal protein S18 acetylase RimI-like enzyme